MILFPILLALFTWLLLLWLCNQHKYLNIFEQMAFWFVSALSLFVFELFLEGVLINHLSLAGPLVTFFILLGLFIHRIKLHPHYVQEIFACIRLDFQKISQQFILYKPWKKILVVALLVYALFKIVMLFSINTHMPTFDEDAVAGWDMKTKVFVENKSLVLDKVSPEFLGSALERNIFAPITDTYFLLPYTWDVVGFTNIISPLLYFFTILLLFGIFLRKSDIFFSAIAWYIFASLPFVFIHGFGSYWNFISGVFLFVFIFYILDQILRLDHIVVENKQITIPLMILGFLTTVIRNESFILVISVLLLSAISYYIIQKKHWFSSKRSIVSLWYPIIWIFIGWVSSEYVLSLYPQWNSLNIGWLWTNQWLLSSLLTNIHQPWLLMAPIQQAFYHSDYNLLFLVFLITFLLYIVLRLSYKHIVLYVLSFFILLGWTLMILFANLSLWLVTHYGFVRFSVVYVIFIVYLVVHMSYLLSEKFYIKS